MSTVLKCKGHTVEGKSCTRNRSNGDYCWQHDPERESRKAKKPHPPRPLSAFMYFAGAKRVDIKKAHPDWGVPEIGRALGALWKRSTVEERQPYEDMAIEAKARYERKLAQNE